MTRWIPGALIAIAFAISLAVLSQLPPAINLDMSGWFPPALAIPAEPMPRTALLFGMPSLALAIWLMLHEAPAGWVGRMAWAIFRPLIGTRPEGTSDFEKYAPTYRIVVIWAVSLVIGIHLAALAVALDWPVAPGSIVGFVFGIGLVVVGNVMPRLRPNPIAGVRTRQTLRDPKAWARVHRRLGGMWIISGVIIVVVGFVAPRYAFVTAVGLLTLSLLAGLAGGGGKNDVALTSKD
ncbi:MAG: SdpI family protein [Gemmatimonadaceae bacterium]|nr:SdpI family protein [Gemmatimonadaceae bacterium]